MVNAKRLTLGNGQILLDGIDVGYVKGSVNFTVTREITDFEAGVPQQVQASACVSEKAMIKFTQAEMKPNNWYRAIGAGELGTGGTMRMVEERIVLSGTISTALARANVTNIVKVQSLGDAITGDPLTYLAGTDYTGSTGITGGVARIGAGAITAGATVVVDYDFGDATLETFRVGGENTVSTLDLRFIHKSAVTGKRLEIHLFRARTSGSMDLPFNEKEFTTYDVEYVALADNSRACGEQLFEILMEKPGLTVGC